MIRWHRRTEACVMQDQQAMCQQVDSTFLTTVILPVGYYSSEHTRTYRCVGTREITSDNLQRQAQMFGTLRQQNVGPAVVRVHPKPALPLFHRGEDVLCDSLVTAVYEGALTGACNATMGALVAAAGTALWGARAWATSAGLVGGALTALATGLAQSCSVARNIDLRRFMGDCNDTLLKIQAAGLGDECADLLLLLRIKAQDDQDKWRLLDHMIDTCCHHYGISAHNLLNGVDVAK